MCVLVFRGGTGECVCVFVPAQSCTSHTHQTLADWACFRGICAECISSWRRARPRIRPSPKCWFCCCPDQPGSLPSWRKQRKVQRNSYVLDHMCTHTHTLSPFNFGVINVVTGQEDYCGLKLGPSQQLTPHSRTNKAVLSQNLEKGDSKDCSQTDQSTVCFQCVELLTCINYFVFLWNSLL